MNGAEFQVMKNGVTYLKEISINLKEIKEELESIKIALKISRE